MKTLRRRMPVLVAIASTLALSCVDSGGPTAATPELPSVVPGARFTILGVDFLACTPMTADSVTQSVGPGGGTIAVGPHEVIIPSGALDSTVSITAVAPSDTINRLQLYPEGLEFDKPVSLQMSYANCSAINSLVPKRIAYVDSSFSVLDLLASLDAWWDQVVIGKTSHFSDYVVAW